MAYKVVCTKCGKPVKIVVAKDSKSFSMCCKCRGNSYTYTPTEGGRWQIQESGVIPKSDRQKYCSGCEENFYNGNNTVGVKVCWNLKSAKVVKKQKIGIDDEPPWEHQPVVTTLSCFHQKGYVFYSPDTRRY